MVKTLTKHGNSYALIIDKPILELLRATPETPFEIMTNGDSLIITPLRDSEDEARFNNALQKLHEQFGNAMRKLAE